MSAPTLAPEVAVATAPAAPTDRTFALARALRRPGVAVSVLVVVYALLAAACDPMGQLSGDTGGRIATLEAMARGHWPRPEVGYWAAGADPAGALHPMWRIAVVNGHWLTVGTAVTLIAGSPLFAVGGYRALLVFPIAGAVLAALAARRLSQRLGSRGDGWPAFWAVGLASPLTVYALDFWDHALGVGLVLWGVASLVDLLEDRPGTRTAIRRGAVAGLCLGTAATLRTEAFVYSAVVAIAVAGALVVQRRWRTIVAAGAALAAVAASCLLANGVLERVVLGASFRGARTVGTVDATGFAAGARARIAYYSGLAFRPSLTPRAVLEALVFLAVVVVLCRAVRRGDDRATRFAVVAALVVVAYRLSLGWGFVPGLLTATPLALVGAVLGRRQPRAALLLAVASTGLVLVLATQYAEVQGNTAIWAGRYVLVSGALAAVVGVTALERFGRRAVAAGIAVSLAVTAFGVGMLIVRTNGIGEWTRAVAARSEDVVVSRVPPAFRDAGAAYTPERRWLTAEDDAELGRSFAVAEEAGFVTVALVEEPAPTATDVDGWCRGRADYVAWVPTVQLRITHYDRVDPGGACPG
jgi:hypothetical protein